MTKEEKLKYDTQKGDYWEAVGLIVDSLIDLIKEKEITSRHDLMSRLEEAVNGDSYTNTDELCIHTLQFSNHPTARFFNHGHLVGLDENRQLFLLSGVGPATRYKTPYLAWDAGRAEFPWQAFARDAMEDDVKKKLEEDKQYMNLFHALPHDNQDEDVEEYDDGEEEGGQSGGS